MKTYSISARTFVSAAKHQWKRFLAIVVAFAVLGAGGGWLYAGRGSAGTGGGGANSLPEVDFETVAYTQDYYVDCLQAINRAYTLLNSYLNLTSSAELPVGEMEKLLKRIDSLKTEMTEFQKTILVPLQVTLTVSGALNIPEEFIDSLASQYESRLSAIEIDLLAAEAAAETVRQMEAPHYDSVNITNNYANLLSLAVNYGNLLRNKAIYEKGLSLLRDEPERVRSGSREVERALNQAAAELNALMERATQAAEEVGKAADVIITLQPNGTSYNVVLNHTYRAIPWVESFAAIELFCVLTGVCAGAFLAVCRETKEEKARQSQPSA